MKLAREKLDQAEKLFVNVHKNSPVDIKLEAARVLVEAAKVEAMIEMGGELNDISTVLNNIDGSLMHLDR